MRYPPADGGWIEVIVGSMFSGKTTELLRRCDRMRRAGRRIQIFSRDTRFDTDAVVSHDRRKEQCTHAETCADIMNALDWKAEVIAIDEGQFYDDGLVELCRRLAHAGKVVIVAGLDQDYLSAPFAPMIELLAEAEFVDKLCAVCVRCGSPAIRNFRKSTRSERIVLGAAESYEALCRRCFDKAMREGKQEELF